jgi:hypothetical protein
MIKTPAPIPKADIDKNLPSRDHAAGFGRWTLGIQICARRGLHDLRRCIGAPQARADPDARRQINRADAIDIRVGFR